MTGITAGRDDRNLQFTNYAVTPETSCPWSGPTVALGFALG
ncbi:hypothetical protein [Mesorhizobium sp. B2-9-1]|nr:hypothetical protein [Mesorhizobium sp. B2-9-1]